MKVKKVLAMLLASAMIMGSAVTTFAAVPQENDSATVSVSDVDIDSTVYAYQIVEATYNSSGFTGYISVKDGDQNLVADPENPTSSEVGNIAQRINSGELSSLTRVQLTDEEDDGTYTGTLNPGYWVVLVRTTGGDVKVYNPMLVGVYYTENGENGQLTSSPVSANSNWNLETVNAWAKSSDIPFEKTADSDTENLGGTVVYTISTEIPQYGPEYSDVTFDVKDTLTDLELTDGTITVQEKVGEEWTNIANSDGSAYEIEGNTAGSKTFTVSFKSDWIKNNGGKEIQIVYTATVTGTGVNTDSNDNYAELTYTNNPDSSTGGQTDIEKIYSFDIDSNVTGNIIQKVQPGENENTTEPLAGAEFTLYIDRDCKIQYTNSQHPAGQATAISGQDGKLLITGLAEGTYYLKETKAPGEYTLNNTVYEIVIDAVVENEELVSWSIKVTDLTTGTDVTNNFTVNNGTVDKGENNDTTEIMNTTLSTLPSTGGIGTTIFTIGGCVIMIAAAGLYFASRRRQENK